MIIRSTPSSVLRSNGFGSLCLACFQHTSTSTSRKITRNFSQTAKIRAALAGGNPRLRAGYFSANSLLEKARVSARRGTLTSTVAEGDINGGNNSSISEHLPAQPAPNPTEDLPHRRRQKARREAAAASDTSSEFVLPQNVSDSLTTRASSAPPSSIRRIASSCLSLSKPRLSVLVVLTAMATYSLYPVPELLSPSATDAPSLSTLTLLFLTTGTTLCAASANAFNMLYEPKWDAMMSRTKNRPLVRGLISTRGAVLFAVLSGIVGVGSLYYGVNPTVAFLGGLNIALYAGVYTPMKRISVLNTWVGAIVGGIPPLMGWAAAAGQSATHGDWKELLFGEQSLGGWIMASLLVSWQFAHFMALSWPIREEYKNAGYRMLCWVNPARNGRVALRYSLTFLPLCIALSYIGVTEWAFAVASTPLNIWLVREAYKFWRYEGLKGGARGLFWASIWHLPGLLMLAMVMKKGLWQRVWRAALGEPDLEGDEDWEEEEEEPVVLATGRRPAIVIPSR